MNCKVKKTMSLALVSALGLGLSACGGGGGGSSAPSTATDVTVERGKVFEATVVDSSSPVQTAVQKANQNVYTFASTPTYPIKVTGGWIDVNDDGTMDANDVVLDVELVSYSNVVTPITTYIASSDETIRNNKLAELVASINAASTTGTVTAADLLKVPSSAPLDTALLANAIYKEMKMEGSSYNATKESVINYFNSVKQVIGSETNIAAIEEIIMSSLSGYISNVTSAQIAAYMNAHPTSNDGNQNPTNNYSDYSVLWIYKNIDATYANSLENSYNYFENFNATSVSSSVTCASYGFSNPTTTSASGITITTYYTAGSSRYCYEADYSSLSYAQGTANILFAYNQ